MTVRLLSWNILQGGGRRTEAIVDYLQASRADIVTLQEFRQGPAGERICLTLKRMGLGWQWVAKPPSAAANTLLLAARAPFDAGDFMPHPSGTCHIMEAMFSGGSTAGLTLLPVHFPQKAAQVPLFRALAEDSPSLLAGPALLVGDLNCGIPFQDSDSKTFINTAEFSRLLDLGWRDVFRSRHPSAQTFSWVSPRTGNRFRYDHCLASPAADSLVTSVRYDQEPRLSGFSDHAALLVELQPPRTTSSR